MNDHFDRRTAAAPHSSGSSWLIFTAAGEQFAMPMAIVETVIAPPPLTAVPHAPAALLGAANLGGQIVPIVDLARLLGRRRPPGSYDGSGEIVRLRSSGGGVGAWIDRVERVVLVDPEHAVAVDGNAPSARDLLDDFSNINLIDPTPLIAAGLAPPLLAVESQAPLGVVPDEVHRSSLSPDGAAYILIDVCGKAIQLDRDAIIELLDAVPWTRLPRSPKGLLGIGVLRGSALPILSLAALLDLPEAGMPGGFALADIDGHRMLLALDRVVGLRFQNPDGIPADGETIDLAAIIPAALYGAIAGFRHGNAAASDEDAAEERLVYLAFSVAGQDFAVPIASVDRIVGPQPLIRLPCAANDDDFLAQTAAAIELRGRIVPVAALHHRLGLDAPDHCGTAAGTGAEGAGAVGAGAVDGEPSAYVILSGRDGLSAIGVDRVKQIVALHPADIATPAIGGDLIEGVAFVADGSTHDRTLLRLIRPSRLWSRG